MIQYLELLADILENGHERDDRTGTGTIGVFGKHATFDLTAGFPIVTTKKIWWKGIVEELLWFLRGETNVKSLQEKGVKIWDAWADSYGELGPIYGWNWRHWDANYDHAVQFPHGPDRDSFLSTGYPGIDQIAELEKSLREDPFSRRHILNAWNVSDIPQMALPPCHLLAQFHTQKWEGNTIDIETGIFGPKILMLLSCQMYQRSADAFLGLPWNISSYALLTHLLAKALGPEWRPWRLHFCLGDLHIYKNHIEQVNEQLTRIPYSLPRLQLPETERKSRPAIDEFISLRSEDFILKNYHHHPEIRGEISV